MFRLSNNMVGVQGRRFLFTLSKSKTATKAATPAPKAPRFSAEVTVPSGLSEKIKVVPTDHYKQAPNRDAVWSPSQISRDEVYHNNPRFVGVDLTKQPQGLSAMELTKQQPIIYLKKDIAVCNGTDRFQGHPKVYLNLDKDKVTSCGYCGAKYAREDLKGKL